MIQIRDREEYDYATKRGFKPLLDYKHFKMDIRLRIEIQTELFGRGVIAVSYTHLTLPTT